MDALGLNRGIFQGESLVHEFSSRQFSVSVIIPAFNVEDLISRALDSVLEQAVKPSEILVVDDGSTDSTRQQVKRYGDIVRYIRQKNSGPSVARNTGIRAATGDWIAFLDADDLWHTDKLAADARVAEAAPDLSWIISNHYLCVFGDEQKFPRFDPEISQTRLGGNPAHGSFLEALTWGLGWDPLGIVVKKNVIEEVGGFRPGLNYGEDLDLCLKIAHLYPMVGIQPHPVAVHFINRPSGLSLRRSIPKQMGTLRDIYEKHAESAARTGSLDYLNMTLRTIVQDNMATLLQEGKPVDVLKVVSRFRDLLPTSYVAAIFGLLCLPRGCRWATYSKLQWKIRGIG